MEAGKPLESSNLKAQVKVNVCVIGASGLIGTRHVQHCISEPLVNLSCIVDPVPVSVPTSTTTTTTTITDPPYEDVTQVTHEPRAPRPVAYFATVDEMLRARENGEIRVDGVILGTPNATHVELGLRMVRSGIDVLVEKVSPPSYSRAHTPE